MQKNGKFLSFWQFFKSEKNILKLFFKKSIFGLKFVF